MHPISAANELFNADFGEFTHLLEICNLLSPLSTERGLYSAVHEEGSGWLFIDVEH